MTAAPIIAPLTGRLAPPPLRADPTQPDSQDGDRIAYWRRRWHSQDDALRQRDRLAEDLVRMICGQQWSVFNSHLQKTVDVGNWFGDKERWWRQRPVVNRMFYWFVLTHARMTENPSVITFKPATGARFDGMLAEVMDPIYKSIWSNAGMDDVIDTRAAWLIATGEAYVLSRLDLNRGPLKPWIGPAMLPLLGPDGQPMAGPNGQPIEMMAEAVPYDAQGNPLARLNPDGSYQATGEPHTEREGEIVVEAPCPLQIRGQWGQTPWHLKRWQGMYSWLSLEDIYEQYGIECTPESTGLLGGTHSELGRLLMGSGWMGAGAGNGPAEGNVANYKEGFAGVWSMWERPNSFSPETEQSPGGRLTVMTSTKVLYDGPRNAAFPYTGPLRRYEYVKVPGRPAGSTPAEPMAALQRTYNHGYRQILEHRNLSTNPVTVVDQASGISPKQLMSKPGLVIKAILRNGVEPIRFVQPGRLGEEVFRTQELLRREMQDFGNIEGAEGKTPTSDASGALVQELRFNSDRSSGPTLRRIVTEDARLVEDHMALVKAHWTEEKIISYAGDDQVATTLVVLPEMFKYGRVNVVPDLSSAITESPQERQAKWLLLYDKGVFGPPGTPESTMKYLEAARFPHLARAINAGSVDAITAQQENGELVRGQVAQMIESYEFYNHEVHLMVHTKFMSSPEFKKLDPNAKQQFMIHRDVHFQAVQQALLQQMVQQAQAQQAGGGAPPPPAP